MCSTCLDNLQQAEENVEVEEIVKEEMLEKERKEENE